MDHAVPPGPELKPLTNVVGDDGEVVEHDEGEVVEHDEGEVVEHAPVVIPEIPEVETGGKDTKKKKTWQEMLPEIAKDAKERFGKHEKGSKDTPEEIIAKDVKKKQQERDVAARLVADKLKHDESGTRRAAAEALGKLGLEISKPYIPDITMLLDDSDQQVRKVAAKALAKLGVAGDSGLGCSKPGFVRALEADGPADKSILGWFMVSCSASGQQCRLRCKKGYRIQGGLGTGNITYNCSGEFGRKWTPVGGEVRFDPFQGMVPCGAETKVEGCNVPLMDFGVGRLYSCLGIKNNPYIIFGETIATECVKRCSSLADKSDACTEPGIVRHNLALPSNRADAGSLKRAPPPSLPPKVSCKAIGDPWGEISLKIPANGIEMCIR
eukprot:SAG22_NODE_145_length_17656_cov_33.457367_6_plen_382_part_00